jgi:transcriptional regulator with XRE-family HTH domain
MDKDQSLLTRFGQLVRSVREERGFTQKELADRAGMTDKHVGEIERGVAEASITAIVALADGLRVRLSAIMPDQLRTKHARTHRHTQTTTLN